MGYPCIMGRKTWDSLPRKPLPGRTNIVVTRNSDLKAEGARVAASFEDALRFAREENPAEIMVIGGEAIYEAAFAHAHRIYLTRVSGAFEGDAYFHLPEKGWREVASQGPFEEGAYTYRYMTLERG
jgi:dihydrofolate reductase